MFQVAIYGAGQCGAFMRQIIEKQYNSMVEERRGETFSVAAYMVDRRMPRNPVDELPVLDLSDVSAMYGKGEIHGILLPREAFWGMDQPVVRLTALGVDIRDIYVAERMIPANIQPQSITSFFTPYLSARYLPYLEFHIADHCNLKCRACTHYSGLVEDETFPDLTKFSMDMERLHSLIDDIGMIRILGGEPLLNPDINEYMSMTRLLYPQSHICVVTNGLRLLSMPEDFFDAVRRYRIQVHVSWYPPMSAKKQEMEEHLKTHGVSYLFTRLANTFDMSQTLEEAPDSAYFYDCFQTRCHNLYEGKLAACPLGFMTKYFNAYFHMNLPEDGGIDLYEEGLATEELKARLLVPFERCRYCRPPVSAPWGQIRHPSVLSDWVVGGKAP